MTARLRLDLVVRTYSKPGLDIGGKGVDRWTWRLWSGSRIVSSSGSQRYSRRIDCARGAEVGAGLFAVVESLSGSRVMDSAWRFGPLGHEDVEIRILDERTAVTS